MFIFMCSMVLFVPVAADDGESGQNPPAAPMEQPTGVPDPVPVDVAPVQVTEAPTEVPTQVPTEQPTLFMPGTLSADLSVEPTLVPTESVTGIPTPDPTPDQVPEAGGSIAQAVENLMPEDPIDPPIDDPAYPVQMTDGTGNKYWEIGSGQGGMTWYLDKLFSTGHDIGIKITGNGVTLTGNPNNDGSQYTLDGTNANNNLYGIWAQGVTGLKILDIKLTNWATGIFLDNVNGAVLDNVAIDNGNVGIKVSDSNLVSISNAKITNMNQAGILVQDSDWVEAVNSSFNNIGNWNQPVVTGIGFTDSNNVTIRNNTLSNLKGTNIYGINVTGSSEGSIYNNTLKTFGDYSNEKGKNTYGIIEKGVRNHTIYNNTLTSIYGNGTSVGIGLYDSNWGSGDIPDDYIDNNHIHGNRLDTIGKIITAGNAWNKGNKLTYGIEVSNSTLTTITSNQLVNINANYYTDASHNYQGSSDGIFVNSSDGAIVWNNSVKTVYAYYPSGITFKDVDNGFIKNNVVDDVDPENSPAYGIRLISSDRNIVDNNSVNDIFNYENYGLYLEDSSENNITSNIITPKTAHAYSGRNYYVIGLSTGSNNNLIYNNYFANSSGNAVRFIGTNTGNVWNTTQTQGRNIVGGPYTGGNYWGRNDTSRGWSETNPVNPTTKFITNPFTIAGGSATDKDYLPLSYQTTPKPKPTPNAPEAPSCYTECRNCRIHQVCTIEDPINVMDIDTGQYCNECKRTWEACGPEGWTIYKEYCDGHVEEQVTGPCPTVTPFETPTPTATVTPFETPTPLWTPPVIPTPDLPPLPPLGDCCNFTVMNITANETMFIGQKYLVNVTLVNDCGQCWNNTTALWPWNEPAKQFNPSPIWMRNNTCEYQPYTFSFWITAPDIREDHYTLQYRLYRNNTTCGDIIWFDVNLSRFATTAQKKTEKVQNPVVPGRIAPGTGNVPDATIKPDDFAGRKFSQVPTIREPNENRLLPQKTTDYRQSVGPEPTISTVVTIMKRVTGTLPPLKTAR